MISRRNFFGMLVFSAGLIAVGAGFAGMPLAVAKDISAEELMKTGPLEERILGSDSAPVTFVEYASMTCGHCASFHNDVWPQFKEKYVDTGKVKFVFREFPLDPLAMGAFMLARCSGKDQYFPLVEVLFRDQRRWVQTSDPLSELFSIARQVGFSQENFDKCLSNQQLFDDIKWVKARAAENFDVRSTPTFFVNGEILRGVPSLAELDELLATKLEQ